MTDCKSLFDSVHRAGGPRAPSEKRLLVDLAKLRLEPRNPGYFWKVFEVGPCKPSAS